MGGSASRRSSTLAAYTRTRADRWNYLKCGRPKRRRRSISWICGNCSGWPRAGTFQGRIRYGDGRRRGCADDCYGSFDGRYRPGQDLAIAWCWALTTRGSRAPVPALCRSMKSGKEEIMVKLTLRRNLEEIRSPGYASGMEQAGQEDFSTGGNRTGGRRLPSPWPDERAPWPDERAPRAPMADRASTANCSSGPSTSLHRGWSR